MLARTQAPWRLFYGGRAGHATAPRQQMPCWVLPQGWATLSRACRWTSRTRRPCASKPLYPGQLCAVQQGLRFARTAAMEENVRLARIYRARPKTAPRQRWFRKTHPSNHPLLLAPTEEGLSLQQLAAGPEAPGQCKLGRLRGCRLGQVRLGFVLAARRLRRHVARRSDKTLSLVTCVPLRCPAPPECPSSMFSFTRFVSPAALVVYRDCSTYLRVCGSACQTRAHGKQVRRRQHPLASKKKREKLPKTRYVQCFSTQWRLRRFRRNPACLVASIPAMSAFPRGHFQGAILEACCRSCRNAADAREVGEVGDGICGVS